MHFIGYTGLKPLLATKTGNGIAYLVTRKELDPGTTCAKCSFLVQLIDKEGSVHYWLHVFAYYDAARSPEQEQKTKLAAKMAEQGEPLITAYLRRAQYRVRSGMIAMPEGQKYLDAENDVLKWDEESQSFSLVEPSPERFPTDVHRQRRPNHKRDRRFATCLLPTDWRHHLGAPARRLP
jgi:hypothetical protein